MRKSEGPKAFFAALAVTAIGVVWFVGGLAVFNIFFFYPIILVVAGVIGMFANIGGLFRGLSQPQLPAQRLPYAPPSQPMYYSPQLAQQPQQMPQAIPLAATCWQCGAPNRGHVVCLSCGAAQPTQPTQPSQQPMGAYGAPSGYPLTSGYPPAPGYAPASGYPPAPGYPPAANYPQVSSYPPAPGYPPAASRSAAPANEWGQPPQAPQPPQPPQHQGW